jgi:predicted phosphodiesterase
MHYLVISDIHANLAALEAVLKDAEGRYEFVWCLGDLVGYGPDPNACIERLRKLPLICIAGNHDWAVLGKLDLDDFNTDARRSCLWTRRELSEENRDYLASLPVSWVEGEFTLVHGSPRHPTWEYILYPAIAVPNFSHFSTQYCLVGHTHNPVIFHLFPEGSEYSCEALLPSLNGPVSLGEDRLIINPGSVGQPRDGDARASYTILDTEELTVEFRRVFYPVSETQEHMRAADLPARLIFRLAYGW